MAKRKIKSTFDPDNLAPFKIPNSLFNQLGEFSKDSSWILALKNSANEIEVIENFTNRTDYMAFMVHLGVHTNANLGLTAQEIGDDICGEGEFDDED